MREKVQQSLHPGSGRSETSRLVTRVHTLIGQLQAPLKTASLLKTAISWICSLAIMAAFFERCFACRLFGCVSVIGVDMVEEGELYRAPCSSSWVYNANGEDQTVITTRHKD